MVAAGRKAYCNHCGEPLATPEETRAAAREATARALAPVIADSPPTVVRVYRGNQQADAARAFQAEAVVLAKLGYTPTSQSWAQGQWGCGAFLLALILFVVLIGILIFLYLLIVKPEGTLTVTYELQSEGAAKPPRAASERLQQLDELRAAGSITDGEYAAKRAKIIEDI